MYVSVSQCSGVCSVVESSCSRNVSLMLSWELLLARFAGGVSGPILISVAAQVCWYADQEQESYAAVTTRLESENQSD